jgi:hypothetical protein
MKLNTNQALFWCASEADFLVMKQVMDDPKSWPDTYAEFVTKVSQFISEKANDGLIITKTECNPERFVVWCKLHDRKPDIKSRQVYAAIQFGRHPKDSN